jgi:hypothetical protein
LADRIDRIAARAPLGLALLLAAPAPALQIDPGDLVGVFVKGGTEVVVNLGPADPGGMLDLAANVFDNPEFDGSASGAKFVGLAVEDPGRTVNVPGVGPVLAHNLVYTSQVVDPMPTDAEIEVAMNAVDVALPGANTWFNLLRQLPGSDTEVIATSEAFSYTNVLGFGTDAVANSFTFSTAGTVDEQGRVSIAVYGAQRGYESFGGPPTEYLQISTLQIDGTSVDFEPAPEAGALAGTLVGAAVLAAAGARRRRR